MTLSECSKRAYGFLIRRHWKCVTGVVALVLVVLVVAGIVQVFIRRTVKSEIEKNSGMWPEKRVEMILAVFRGLANARSARTPQRPSGSGELRGGSMYSPGHSLSVWSRHLSFGIFDTIEEELAASPNVRERYMAVSLYGLYFPPSSCSLEGLERLAADPDPFVAELAECWLEHMKGSGAARENGWLRTTTARIPRALARLQSYSLFTVLRLRRGTHRLCQRGSSGDGYEWRSVKQLRQMAQVELSR